MSTKMIGSHTRKANLGYSDGMINVTDIGIIGKVATYRQILGADRKTNSVTI